MGTSRRRVIESSDFMRGTRALITGRHRLTLICQRFSKSIRRNLLAGGLRAAARDERRPKRNAMVTRRCFFSLASAGALASLAPARWHRARAQAVRGTTRIIVGFPPGGPVDIVARLLVTEMKDYASPIIVENRPGAGGRLALDTLKASATDGWVFLLPPASMITIYPHVYKSLGYNPAQDFSPVTPVCAFSYVLAIGPAVPASVRMLTDFVAWCRANPQAATYGSPSAG